MKTKIKIKSVFGSVLFELEKENNSVRYTLIEAVNNGANLGDADLGGANLGITPFVQPYRDFENERKPTNYELDLARWANRMWLFKSIDFEDYSPRKGFKCKQYLKR